MKAAASRFLLPFRKARIHNWAAVVEREHRRGDLVAAFTAAARAAKAGDIQAQAAVANMYLKGSGVPQSRRSAALWLERAARGGDAHSMVALAKLSLTGYGPETSLFGGASRTQSGVALHWAQSAAATGLPEGKSLLAFLLRTSEGYTAPSAKNARALLDQASAAGDPSACLQLAIELRRSEPLHDPERVTSLLRHAAKSGLPMAVYLLGVAASVGFGCPQDSFAAVRRFEEAAKLGMVPAQLRYGSALLLGDHVQANVVAAETWLRRAAIAGDCRAASYIGHMRAGLDRYPPDFIEAGRWFSQAARMGDASAARIMGLIHILGLGTQEDPRAAAIWIVRSQRLPALAPQDPAALVVEQGPLHPARVTARHWFERDAASGNTLAAYRLGVCLAMGTDTAPAYNEAAKWLRLAMADFPAASFRYGQLILAGHVNGADRSIGLELIKKAAEAGHCDAQFVSAGLREFGVSHAQGVG